MADESSYGERAAVATKGRDFTRHKRGAHEATAKISGSPAQIFEQKMSDDKNCRAAARSEGRTFAVVTADDLGYNATRDAGIVRSFHMSGTGWHSLASFCGKLALPRVLLSVSLQLQAAKEGIVSAVSLMVTGASAVSAMRQATAVPALDIGLHMNVTEGAPVCAASSVPSLLENPGAPVPVFRGKMGFRAALAVGHISLAELRAELDAQVRLFLALHPAHEAPSHADGHQHFHVLPGVCDVVAEVLASHAVQHVRVPELHTSEDLSAISRERAAFYRGISEQAAAARRVFVAAGLRSTQAFIGYSTMGADCSVARISSLLRSVAQWEAVEKTEGAHREGELQTGAMTCAVSLAFMTDGRITPAPGTLQGCRRRTVELMFHPGLPVPAGTPVAEAGCGQPEGADEFAMSADRQHELDVLTDPRLRQALQELGVRVGRWTDTVIDSEDKSGVADA